MILLLGKHLLALKCLSAAYALDPSYPRLHLQLLRFRKALDGLSEPLPAPIAEAIDAGLEKMLPKAQSLEEWNTSYLASKKDSAPHVLAALSARQLLKPDSKEQCEKDAVALLDSPSITIDDAVAALEALKKWGSNLSAFRQKASEKWPQASFFTAE